MIEAENLPKRVEGNAHFRSSLAERPKLLKRRAKICTKTQPVTLTVSVKTLDVEPAAGSKDAALRLLCRAMIRLYVRDCGDP